MFLFLCVFVSRGTMLLSGVFRESGGSASFILFLSRVSRPTLLRDLFAGGRVVLLCSLRVAWPTLLRDVFDREPCPVSSPYFSRRKCGTGVDCVVCSRDDVDVGFAARRCHV